ncbi:MAG: DNA adenine methylase [Tepidisphaeraceae bacterium]
MKRSGNRLRPPVKWHGGKHYLAEWIIGQFSAHRVYLEPFGGAASVLLNKPPVEVEAYNDLDLRITRLFRVLQNQGVEFVSRVRFIPYSQKEFEDAGSYPANATEVDKAVSDFVRWRQSFGGKGKNWSYTTARARGGMAGDVNAWWTAIDQLPEIIERLKRVQILHQPALQAIRRFDSPDTLIYCDPPYLHETRSENSRNIYGVEMSQEDHRQLAAVLNSCAGTVVLSGYPSAVYDLLLRDWRRVEFKIANHAAGGRTKSRKTEVIWIKEGHRADNLASCRRKPDQKRIFSGTGRQVP